MVDDLTNRLTDILSGEVKCFDKILGILMQEQRCLVENNVEDLRALLSHKEDVLNSLSCLEKSRQNILEKLSDLLEEEAAELTVNRIADRIKGQKGRHLREIGNTLKSLYDKIKKVEYSNYKLICLALEFNSKSLWFMQSLYGQQELYNEGGGLDTRGTVSLKLNRRL